MTGTDLYTEGHLMVAAIRVLTHRDGTPPSVESASELANMAREQGYRICNKLDELGIVRILEGPFGTKLDILDHTLLEDIPEIAPQTSMEEELQKFQSARKGLTSKVENIKAEQQEKKKSLFADLEKQFKQKTGAPDPPDES